MIQPRLPHPTTPLRAQAMAKEREVAIKVGRDAMRVMEELKATQGMMGQSVLAGEQLKKELSVEGGGRSCLRAPLTPRCTRLWRLAGRAIGARPGLPGHALAGARDRWLSLRLADCCTAPPLPPPPPTPPTLTHPHPHPDPPTPTPRPPPTPPP
jgi:hypothetical protein